MTVVKFLRLIVGRTKNAYTPLVIFQSKYLVSALNFMSWLNVGFGYNAVNLRAFVHCVKVSVRIDGVVEWRTFRRQ